MYLIRTTVTPQHLATASAQAVRDVSPKLLVHEIKDEKQHVDEQISHTLRGDAKGSV